MAYQEEWEWTTRKYVSMVLGIVAFLMLLLGLGMWGCPKYSVYAQRKSGEAKLAEAQYSRKIATLEAEAKMESAKSLAAVDTIRAMGVASANKIIGQSLKQNDEYLTWLWIEALKEGGNDVIYVPTEANMPILEAGRFMLHKRDR